MMKVKAKLFAALREQIKEREMELQLPLGSTLQGLIDTMVQQYPLLHDYLPSLHFAVNRKYASLETELHDGDEVALLPPVGGG